MRVNFTAPLTDLDGNSVDGTDNKPLTLRNMAIQSLMMNYPNENPDGAEKYRRFRLATLISETDDLELPLEDITYLKTLIGKCFTPLGVGRAWDLLERKNE